MSGEYKTPFYTDGLGNKFPRPPKMDIKPKAFKLSPMAMLMLFDVPSERRLLYLISKYPYYFNVFFHTDVLNTFKGSESPDSKFQKIIKVFNDLEGKGYLRKSKDRLRYTITPKGQIFRVTNHVSWPIVPVSVTILVGFSIFALNKGCKEEPTKVELLPTNSMTDSSFQSTPVQIPALTKKDSVFLPSDKTKSQNTILPSDTTPPTFNKAKN